MRAHLAEFNVYRWAGMLLSEAGKLVQARPLVEPRAALEVTA